MGGVGVGGSYGATTRGRGAVSAGATARWPGPWTGTVGKNWGGIGVGYSTAWVGLAAWRGVGNEVAVTSGTVVPMDVRLPPLPGSLDGTVTNAATGTPVAGAAVLQRWSERLSRWFSVLRNTPLHSANTHR